jgi:hypothetical protein
VALSFLYRVIHRLLEAIRLHRMGAATKDAEVLVLRRQLAVLKRQVARPASDGRIELSSVPSLTWSSVSGGHPSSSRPKRSFAGIAPFFGNDGLTPTGGLAVRP